LNQKASQPKHALPPDPTAAAPAAAAAAAALPAAAAAAAACPAVPYPSWALLLLLQAGRCLQD
jgi:hypothetical protein